MKDDKNLPRCRCRRFHRCFPLTDVRKEWHCTVLRPVKKFFFSKLYLGLPHVNRKIFGCAYSYEWKYAMLSLRWQIAVHVPQGVVARLRPPLQQILYLSRFWDTDIESNHLQYPTPSDWELQRTCSWFDPDTLHGFSRLTECPFRTLYHLLGSGSFGSPKISIISVCLASVIFLIQTCKQSQLSASFLTTSSTLSTSSAPSV